MGGDFFLTADIDLTEALSEGGSLYNKNLTIASGEIAASSRGGAICVENAGTIDNCASHATITGSASASVGGICATTYTNIDDCANHGTISAQADTSAEGYAGSNYYVVNFDQLNAMQMRTPCTLELFSKTTNERVSNTLYYSIESYAHSMRNSSDTALVTLLGEMMKYGDSTAAYFG